MARRHYHSAICDPNVFILHYTEEDEREMRGGVGRRGGGEKKGGMTRDRAEGAREIRTDSGSRERER